MSPLFAFQVFGSIALMALVLGTVWIPAWRRRRAEAPLRAELRARRANYSVTVMTKAPLFGANFPLRDYLQVWITKRGQLAPIWEALIRAGAQPASPPPL